MVADFVFICHYRIDIMLPVIEGNVVEAIDVVNQSLIILSEYFLPFLSVKLMK